MAIAKYRVWIISSQDNDFLRLLRPHVRIDDIVIQYSQNIGGLSHLGGYKRKALDNIGQLSVPIDFDSLKNIFWNKRIKNINSELVLFLNDEEWSALRNIIVQKNPGIEAIINELERRQLQETTLVRNNALIYDAFIAPLQIFFGKILPEGTRNVVESWRRRLLQSNDSESVILEIIPDLKESLPDTFKDVDGNLDQYQKEMAGLYRRKFLEVDSIAYDFGNAGVGLERQQSRLPPEIETQMCVAKDSVTHRELIIYMAHRKGRKQKDLLNADIIYESVLNKSLVLVQYKRLSKEDTIKPLGDQLTGLLQLCSTQRCANRFLNYEEMRLYDCPVYYKLLNHIPRIEYNRQTTEGLYVPACQLAKLAQKNNGLVTKIPDLDRSLHVNSFFELLRTSQIGSNAKIFNALRSEMKTHIQSNILAPDENEQLHIYASEQAGTAQQ